MYDCLSLCPFEYYCLVLLAWQPTTPSVNSGVNSDDFPTAWGTFDEVSEMLLNLPPGCEAATFDVSAAYRITPVRPDQQNALCVFWKGKVYVDRALCFGLASSAGVFGAVADMLVAIYKAYGFGPITKWVDDFFVVRLPHQRYSEQEFMAVTAPAGVPWSIPKLRHFASRQRFTGFDWDLWALVVCFPTDKLEAVLTLLGEWTAFGRCFSLREAASLHGKLVHTSTIFPLIRPFIRSTSKFASSFRSPRASLHVPDAVQADLNWIIELLRTLPNELPLAWKEPWDLLRTLPNELPLAWKEPWDLSVDLAASRRRWTQATSVAFDPRRDILSLRQALLRESQVRISPTRATHLTTTKHSDRWTRTSVGDRGRQGIQLNVNAAPHWLAWRIWMAALNGMGSIVAAPNGDSRLRSVDNAP